MAGALTFTGQGQVWDLKGIKILVFKHQCYLVKEYVVGLYLGVVEGWGDLSYCLHRQAASIESVLWPNPPLFTSSMDE